MIIDRHYLFRLPSDYHPIKTPLLGFDPAVYSRFKYGCPESMAVYSSPLLKLLYDLWHTESRMCITSSAYLNVPTSISLLLDYTLSVDVRQHKRIKLTRSHIIAPDYATLSEDERAQAMRLVDLQFDREAISGNTLIVVDDSRVTGQHEHSILRHIQGICSKLVFVYLVDMGVCKLTDVETRMNSYEVQTLEQIGALMWHPKYVISSRVLKRIFSSTLSEFISFFLSMPGQHQRELYALAISEGYLHMGTLFTEKLNYLQAHKALRQQA